jgi:D-inositol-3-phosphate glycosyltransferase
MTRPDLLLRHPDPATVRRVGLLSVHTSPLEQPGTGDGGGLNVYVLQVARRLAARGIAVDVFTRTTSPAQPPVVQIGEHLRIVRVDAGPAVHLPKEDLPNHLCSFALAMLRDHAADYDLLHAHYWLSGWVARRVAERWDLPFVQTFHTLGALKNATLAPDDVPEPPLRLAAERRIARAADKVVGLTCGEARLLHRTFGLSGADIAVVPAGVDLDVFAPEGAAGESARIVGDLPPGDGPLLLFVGRLQPLKGPDVAIRTLAAVRHKVPDARLLIVGGTSGSGAGRTGPAQLAALADDLGLADAVRVIPARPQEHLAALYRAADVVLAPSRSETFGLVALEAQASGTPVVAANVSGLRYVVGPGGTLVDGHDPDDHAAAVLTYLTDPVRRRTASEEGVRTAQASSWDRTVDRLLGVYGAVVEAHQRPGEGEDPWTVATTAG